MSTASVTSAAASAATANASAMPDDLFDTTTLISLASTVAILATAYGASRSALPAGTRTSTRVLFVWHAFDALIHFLLEGSFLYHCFFTWMPMSNVTYGDLTSGRYYLTMPHPFLGRTDRVYGPQADLDGANPLAQLWMVYARADRRWMGADVGVISLELLTVFIVGPLAVWTCVELARSKTAGLNARASILMVVIATAELYGGFMTFCPEWLTASRNLDTSNFMYKWVYLAFFNLLWVFIPAYALWVAVRTIGDAFAAQAAQTKVKKTK